MEKPYIEIDNNSQPIRISDIPVHDYKNFYLLVDDIMQNKACHCVNYFAVPFFDRYKFFCCIANDETKKIQIISHELLKKHATELTSLTKKHYSFHIFEREMNENYGIEFSDHDWLKPVRFSYNRFDKSKTMETYPFYEMESEELHEVGVGPIHAGVIEPGHFRFICNGEKVIHLEIQLGYQHRGIESLMLVKNNALKRSVLAESIAGDTTIGHSLAFVSLMESLSGKEAQEELQIERIIALELERIAIHIGDTAALCTDVAYQLGQVTCEALRTMIINTTQAWCGNRFGKGLIRICGTNYPLNEEIIKIIKKNLEEVIVRYIETTERIYSLPSVLSRFDNIGVFTKKQAELIGAVGMASRITGLKRDIRYTHPFQYYKKFNYEPVTLESGDVLARGMLRKLEVEKSVKIIFDLLDIYQNCKNKYDIPKPNFRPNRMKPNHLGITLVEGWRGEICHTIITDENGEVAHYKIKDPSMHNWMALALAVRNQEISDFPICNKSFNLSYCGHDL